MYWQTYNLLKKLRQQGKINKQQYYTFKGQLRCGETSACIKGLRKLGLIE